MFLFEFGLRLCLAPDRAAYLLGHLVIDLIPSLPFGFVSHEIDLAEMGRRRRARAGTLDRPRAVTDGWRRYCDFPG